VEPLAEVEVNVPGVIVRDVAPVVAQVSLLLDPELILAGLAMNEEIVGPEPLLSCDDVPAQPVSATATKRKAQIQRLRFPPPELDLAMRLFVPCKKLGDRKGTPSLTAFPPV
jgi:hypothetical protein